MIMTMRKREREKSGIAWNGRTGGKMPARREARSQEARTPTLWGLKRKRFERLTPFFIHPAEAAGDFPVDAEIFGERFTSKTREEEIEGNSKLANSREELYSPKLVIMFAVEKTAKFFFSFLQKKKTSKPRKLNINRDVINSSFIEQIGQRLTCFSVSPY